MSKMLVLNPSGDNTFEISCEMKIQNPKKLVTFHLKRLYISNRITQRKHKPAKNSFMIKCITLKTELYQHNTTKNVSLSAELATKFFSL